MLSHNSGCHCLTRNQRSMTVHSRTGRNRTYGVWLRRGDPSNPRTHALPHMVQLTQIGIAAARETLTTAAPHMAAIWTDLFESMLLPDCDLRWSGDGPGIGRDARIAYSGLLGRYMARAYVTEHEGVKVLVPLDVAKRRLVGSPYSIEKDPPGRGLLADWIGLDDGGLVIVEAKGTYDPQIQAWQGPKAFPKCVETAIGQASRTAVVDRRPGSRQRLPAKCWAIASRWGTQSRPRLDPTLVALTSGKNRLPRNQYRELADLLLNADADGIIEGLGHGRSDEAEGQSPILRGEPHRGLHVGDLWVEPGFGAFLGGYGVHPLLSRHDIPLLRQMLEFETGIAIVSLSERYLWWLASIKRGLSADEKRSWRTDTYTGSRADAEVSRSEVPFAVQGGLTVAWLQGGRSAVNVAWE